jgi:N-methylhydantoinase B
MALLAACDPTIPTNAGLREAVDFVLPEGIVLNPRFPASVNHYFPTAHVAYNTVLSALGRLNPARAVAPSGLGCGAITVGYRKSRVGKPAVVYELLNTSLGGTSHHDGVAMVMAMNHFTPGTPVEIFESEYPLRVRCYDIVRDSAGAGRYRGGIGYAREFEVLEDSVLTVRSSNHAHAAPGLGGGTSPPPARVILNPDRADREVLDILETRHLKSGDVIRFERSGGGGYGPPSERAPDALRDDVRNGYVSREAAATVYGQPQEET